MISTINKYRNLNADRPRVKLGGYSFILETVDGRSCILLDEKGNFNTESGDTYELNFQFPEGSFELRAELQATPPSEYMNEDGDTFYFKFREELNWDSLCILLQYLLKNKTTLGELRQAGLANEEIMDSDVEMRLVDPSDPEDQDLYNEILDLRFQEFRRAGLWGDDFKFEDARNERDLDGYLTALMHGDKLLNSILMVPKSDEYPLLPLEGHMNYRIPEEYAPSQCMEYCRFVNVDLDSKEVSRKIGLNFGGPVNFLNYFLGMRYAYVGTVTDPVRQKFYTRQGYVMLDETKHISPTWNGNEMMAGFLDMDKVMDRKLGLSEKQHKLIYGRLDPFMARYRKEPAGVR